MLNKQETQHHNEPMRGRIVTASFEDGHNRVECGLEYCECPSHEEHLPPKGTYITVHLEGDPRVGTGNVLVLPTDSEEFQNFLRAFYAAGASYQRLAEWENRVYNLLDAIEKLKLN